MTLRRSGAILALGVLALLPCLAVILLIRQYGGVLPLEDQWDTPGKLLEDQVTGNLHWKYFFVQHNEARKAFTSVVWMLLASNGWSVRLEMYASVLLAALCVLLYLLIARRSAPGSGLAPVLLATIGSVLIFSPIGFAGDPLPWLWGVNLENAIVVFVLIAGVCANVHLRSWPLRYLISVACSIAATYSFANGMALWLLLHPRWYGPGRGELRSTARPTLWLDAGYLAIFAAVVVTYFTGYFRPPSHPSFWEAIARPDRLLAFYFAWVGAPLAPRHGGPLLAVATGVTGVVLLLGCLVAILRRGHWARARPFLVLSAYTLISGGAVSLGRSTVGIGGALAPRYFLHVLVFYLGLNGLLWLYLAPGRDRPWRPLARAALTLVLLLQVALVGYNWRVVYPKEIQAFHARNARGEAALRFVDLIPDNPDLLKLHVLMRSRVERHQRLTQAGVLDVQSGPRSSELELVQTVLDLRGSIFLSSHQDRLRVHGHFPDDPAAHGITHLVFQARSSTREKFFSVIPITIFPRERGSGRRVVEAWISLMNTLPGAQEIRLFGYEGYGRRLMPLGVKMQLLRGEVSPAEILDAATIELRLVPGVARLDAVNGVQVLGREEITVPRGGPLRLTGWAVDAAANRLADQVYVKVAQRMFPVQYRQPRPDVARNLGREEYLESGFYGVLPVPLLGADHAGPFSIVIETRDGEFLEDPARVFIRRAEH